MTINTLKLFDNIRFSRRRLMAGEVLFQAGQPVLALFHVEQGRMALHRDGVTVFTASTGQDFGEAGLFSDRHDCDAVAKSETVVRLYAKTAVLLLLRAHPDLNLAFSAALARQADDLRFRLELSRLKGADARVLAWLAHAGAAAAPITVGQPLSHLAHDLGLTHEALYRALARLQAAGRIGRDGQRTFRLLA